MYPFSVQEVVTLLQQYGNLEPHECTDTVWEDVDSESFTVYPNPVRDFVTISGENLSNISVFNALGQMVYDAPVSTQSITLDLGKYEAGVYMVRVAGENGVSVRRVTVL